MPSGLRAQLPIPPPNQRQLLPAAGKQAGAEGHQRQRWRLGGDGVYVDRIDLGSLRVGSLWEEELDLLPVGAGVDQEVRQAKK